MANYFTRGVDGMENTGAAWYYADGSRLYAGLNMIAAGWERGNE